MHTIRLNERLSLQPQVMMRQLWQSNESDVTDILSSATLQYQFNRNLVVYLYPILQIRFRHIQVSLL